MSFALEKIVPWGRSYEEYVTMFGLTEADLKYRILGCGDGPAGFNAELTKRGSHVISVAWMERSLRSAIQVPMIDHTGLTVSDFRRSKAGKRPVNSSIGRTRIQGEP